MFHPWHHKRVVLSLFTLLLSSSVFAAKKLPEERVAFTAPYNVQLVVIGHTISVSWQWNKPDTITAMKEFGFDVERSDEKVFFSKATTFQDPQLAPGIYSYRVRVRGLVKEKGKWEKLVSEWSEPVSGKIVAACPAAPRIELQVTPTQKVYSSIPSLRFRLQGMVHMDKICTLSGAKYLLDSGRGIVHSGPLKVDPSGRFDTYINAIGPEDEIPTGLVSFSISVTAENDIGPATSDVYTLDVELRNPYAPR